MILKHSRRLQKVEHQVSEIIVKRRLARCNCRRFGSKRKLTIVHNEEELAAIAAVPCPVHGKRLLGPVWIIFSWEMDQDDQQFCHCRPVEQQWNELAESYIRNGEAEELRKGTTTPERIERVRKERAQRWNLDVRTGKSL